MIQRTMVWRVNWISLAKARSDYRKKLEIFRLYPPTAISNIVNPLSVENLATKAIARKVQKERI